MTSKRELQGAVDPAVHKCMVGNKRANTKPELLVRKRLREAGLAGYRLQWKVAGRPDVAWPGKKVALFVNDCFWHRCPYCNLALPKSNVEYWSIKFERNVERDKSNLEKLEAQGWTVFVVWECQLKKKVREETFALLLPQIARALGKPLRTCSVLEDAALADAKASDSTGAASTHGAEEGRSGLRSI